MHLEYQTEIFFNLKMVLSGIIETEARIGLKLDQICITGLNLGAFQIFAIALSTLSKPHPRPPSVRHGRASPKEKGVAKITKKIVAKKRT